MKKLGPKVIVETAHRLGITSDLEEVPALALGTSDVSVYEMVGAMGTFVNKGEHITPFYIDRIEDKNGNLLQQFTPKKKPAMSEEHAYLMVYMLRGGFEESRGTSQGFLGQSGMKAISWQEKQALPKMPLMAGTSV
jgi:penicillin-binding protein 1A